LAPRKKLHGRRLEHLSDVSTIGARAGCRPRRHAHEPSDRFAKPLPYACLLAITATASHRRRQYSRLPSEELFFIFVNIEEQSFVRTEEIFLLRKPNGTSPKPAFAVNNTPGHDERIEAFIRNLKHCRYLCERTKWLAKQNSVLARRCRKIVSTIARNHYGCDADEVTRDSRSPRSTFDQGLG
jgi:hypothetical protein